MTGTSETEFHSQLDTLLEGSGWELNGSTDTSWIHATSAECSPPPAQGWKLHLSASDHSAPTVLERAVPVLVATRTMFKIASSRQTLATLNQGSAGISQIGKFMTVYPADEAAAVALAREFDTLFAGTSGPPVPSDRPLREGGVVHYRYGGFATRWMQQVTGEVSPALQLPDGSLAPDTRLARDAVPEWVDDPFDAAGLVQPRPEPPVLLADRFRPVATLYRSPRNAVFLAIDLVDWRRCVLKRVVVDDGPKGSSSHLLRHEHEMLIRTAGIPAVVKAIGWFDDGDAQMLAMEDIPGLSLYGESDDLSQHGFCMPAAKVVSLVREVCAIVADLHDLGIVHRDLKPSNILVQNNGVVRLIDLELAETTGGKAAPGQGTPGYVAPEQVRGESPHPADDVYSIGAILFSMLTGMDVSTRPEHAPIRVRPLAREVPDDLSALVERCLAPTRSERYRDARELHRALMALGTVTARPIAAYGAVPVPTDGAARGLDFARRMGDALVHDSQQTEHGRTWVSKHPAAPGIPLRDISSGASGVLLALIELARQLPAAHYQAVIAEGAAWINDAPRLEGPLHGGLYVGEGGAATALLRAGQFLGDDALLDAAQRRSREIALLPHQSPDLFNGSAGRARMHLWIAEALGDERSLAAAVAAARHLVSTAVRPTPDRATWTVLPELGGGEQLGYAHGAAGIADVLLDVAEATGEDEFAETAFATGRWLVDQAVVGDDGAAWFASESGQRLWAPLWCHGAVGIGRFLLHLDLAGALTVEQRPLLQATGVAAVRHGRALGPVVCHGIAGSIDHLLDLHQADPRGEHLAEAWALTELLVAFHHEAADGHLRCRGDQQGVYTVDLTSGYAGVAALWLRLAKPELPTLLVGRA